MRLLSLALIAVVGLIHVYLCWLEMFAWESRGPRVFGAVLAEELFAPTKPLAANQGLYNLFLAAGLFWSLTIGDAGWARKVASFFLVCIAIAGVFAAFTGLPTALVAQTIPAVAALVATYLARERKA